MKSLVLISAICLQFGWIYAIGYSTGVGAFSAQDSSGKRYEGTYGLKDGEIVDVKGNLPPNFKPPTDFLPNFEPDFIGFFPEYFRNFENLLKDSGFKYYAPTPQIPYIPTPTYSYSQPAYAIPDYGQHNTIPDYTNYGPVSNHIPTPNYDYHNINRAFQANLDSQKKALDAAHKAYDLTSNQAGYSPDLNPSRSPFYSFEDFPSMPGPQFPPGFPFSGGFPMNNFGNANGASSSAYAGAAVGPGYNHQVAAISPSNPNSPNVFKSTKGSGQPGGFKSVSVSSYSSSADVGGRRVSHQGADTYVNDNGKESRYSVHSP